VLYFLLFHGNSGYANAPKCFVIRTLPVLFHFLIVCLSYFIFVCYVVEENSVRGRILCRHRPVCSSVVRNGLAEYPGRVIGTPHIKKAPGSNFNPAFDYPAIIAASVV